MQQFVVPQFIDVEDKIIGPIAVRQFMTLLAGAAAIFANYQLVYKIFIQNFISFILSSLFILLLTGTFAFFKINGRPFHYFLLNFFVTLQKPRLRVWNKRLQRSDIVIKEIEVEMTPPIPTKAPLTASKLTELSLIVDTGGVYHMESAESSEAVQKPTQPSATPKDIFEGIK